MLFSVVWFCVVTSLISYCQGAVYSDHTKLFEDRLGSSSGYMTTVRPLLDQSDTIQVRVSFYIVAIVEIDAIAQKFVINGFLGLEWKDQIVAWDPADYNQTTFIHPEPKQVWRPRLILANTIEGRDLFEDDYCPMSATFDGNMTWNPGSLFPTSCKLNLFKYPFDEQDCFVEMYSMGLQQEEVEYTTLIDTVSMFYFTKSGEWDVIGTSVVAYNHIVGDLPHFKVGFKLRRLPGFFIVNIVIPIVLMSFLNILVFLIPVDSGEKIGYGITVLLALTVFMSIVSEQLPRSSDTLPLVTIYLLVLTVISVWTVIMAIVIVYFHHREEMETKQHKAATGFRSLFHKVNIMNRTKKNFTSVKVQPANFDRQLSNLATTSDDNRSKNTSGSNAAKPSFNKDTILNMLKGSSSKEDKKEGNSPDDSGKERGGDCGSDSGYVNRWRMFGKHLDCISFITFTVIWISVTVGFLVEISS